MKYFKSAFGILAIALVLAPPQANASAVVILAGVTSDGTWPLDPPGPIEMGGFAVCLAQVTSPDGAVGIVTVQGSSLKTGPWHDLFAVTNPLATGGYYRGPCPAFLQMVVSGYANGTINGNAEGRAK